MKADFLAYSLLWKIEAGCFPKGMPFFNKDMPSGRLHKSGDVGRDKLPGFQQNQMAMLADACNTFPETPPSAYSCLLELPCRPMTMDPKPFFRA